MSANRNDPCPCGSGKKHKKCCGAQPGAASPDTSASLLRMASEHHLAGRLNEAEPLYRRAAASPAGRGDGLHGLGVLAFQRGRFAEACELLGQAIAARPGVPLFHYNLGKAARECGRVEPALAAYREALRLDPRHLPALENLGNLLARESRYAEAVDCFRRAHQLQPANAGTRRALGMALWRAGRFTEAVEVYTSVASDAMARLRLAIMGCTALDSPESIDAARARLDAAIAELEAAAPLPGDPNVELDLTCFHPTYHGRNEAPLLARLGRAVAAAFPSLGYIAPHCRPGAARTPRARPRIGFVSAFFESHSVTKYLGEIIRGIDRERFELWIFTRPGLGDDTASAIRAQADHYVELHFPLEKMREAIAAAELDLLVYADLGMHPTTWLLSFARLAPLQATTYGHPVTSGVPTVDCFISHAAVEPEGAQAHYSERLVLLPAESGFVCFSRPPAQAATLARADLGLAEEAHVYFCPQNLQKVHPDFDRLLLGVLQGDARAVVAFVTDQKDWRPRLEARLARTLGAHAARVVFLPFQARSEDYLSLYLISDVVLDTPHFSGGVTSFEALAMGAPLVTLPGQFMRGRQTLALYRRMEIDDCVAADEAGYVRIALRLANDAGFSARVRAAIGERSARIFEDRGVIAAWNCALGELLAAPPA